MWTRCASAAARAVAAVVRGVDAARRYKEKKGMVVEEMRSELRALYRRASALGTVVSGLLAGTLPIAQLANGRRQVRPPPPSLPPARAQQRHIR